MAQFRKKPVTIDAWQFDGTAASAAIIQAQCPAIKFFDDKRGAYLLIQTLEGDMRADNMDWIIKGVKGEFYPCKPDIFAATYDPVV